MDLTDRDKQEIIRHLEADQPLPDRYRFLLFDDKRQAELVWNGKTNEVCNVVLPFQTIEHVDEPRVESPDDLPLMDDLFAVDARGRQLKGWENKLIWGDNRLVLSSLKGGALREEIEKQGGIKLIYIDPPFDVGADFSMDIEIGGGNFTKAPSVLEEIVYRDTWGQGADSFIAMLYERLILMRDLLAEDGSIYVHCDYRMNGYIRLVLDEVFGKGAGAGYVNEIVWQGAIGETSSKNKKFIKSHETIYLYRKSGVLWNEIFQTYSEASQSLYRYSDDKGRYRIGPTNKPGTGGYFYDLGYGEICPQRGYRMPIETALAWIESGELIIEKGKVPGRKLYMGEGVRCRDVWVDIRATQGNEYLRYPTQKPEALLERIIKASSNEGDVVADFFCGSGTLAAVAEKLGRKWICGDLGKFAVHTTRKRMIGVQRRLKAEGKDYRAFEVLNLGKYERQHYIGVNAGLHEAGRATQQTAKERAFVDLILRAYKAERVDNFSCFHGKKQGRLVTVGPVNLPISRQFVEEIVQECKKKHITKVDLLGFEFEMGLFPQRLNEAKEQGIDLVPKYIPRDVFDKRAVERDQVRFHDVAFIEIKTHVKDGTVAVELTDFSVYYHQGSVENAEQTLRNRGSKVVVKAGRVVKVSKDQHGAITREVLTKKWTDWVDYWSVDFDYESKREIIRERNQAGEWVERWTGDYVFENEWQSFRTRQDRSLEWTTPPHKCPPGNYKIAVKVVDVFGNDTMTVAEVKV